MNVIFLGQMVGATSTAVLDMREKGSTNNAGFLIVLDSGAISIALNSSHNEAFDDPALVPDANKDGSINAETASQAHVIGGCHRFLRATNADTGTASCYLITP